MDIVVVVLAFFGLIVLWAFLKFQPAYAEKRALRIFNQMILAVCALFCLIWVLNVGDLFQSDDLIEYKTAAELSGALGIEVVFLGVFLVLRNFWIFRPSSRRGGF